jgi:hypothetical protein
MEITLTPRQWHLYDYLKTYCIGKKNVQKDEETIKHLPEYSSIKEVQNDRKVLRRVLKRRITTTPEGTYLPISYEDDDFFLARKTLSHVYTALANGDLTKDQIHRFVTSVSLDESLDGQMKLVFGEYEKNIVHFYSSDLLPKKEDDYQELCRKYRELGTGIDPKCLTKEELIKEVENGR